MANINIQLGDTKGISRKMDDLGRIVIPSEFRKELNINEDENPWIEMFLVNDGVYIRKKKFLYKGE
ncbi:MAG: hypothetical protein IJ223_06830 [Clostridia bacterium]|nr:hypothetical protein [Clostridia bacterium]